MDINNFLLALLTLVVAARGTDVVPNNEELPFVESTKPESGDTSAHDNDVGKNSDGLQTDETLYPALYPYPYPYYDDYYSYSAAYPFPLLFGSTYGYRIGRRSGIGYNGYRYPRRSYGLSFYGLGGYRGYRGGLGPRGVRPFAFGSRGFGRGGRGGGFGRGGGLGRGGGGGHGRG